MLRLRLVKDSRIIQIKGKILIASKSAIVGATNSQAMPRSDRPRTRFGALKRTCSPMRPAPVSGWIIAVIVFCSVSAASVRIGKISPGQRRGDRLFELQPLLRGHLLALLLEDLGPVLDQEIEGLLRGALVGDHIVMHPLLHVEQQLCVG